jgi:hypothetical protein
MDQLRPNTPAPMLRNQSNIHDSDLILAAVDGDPPDGIAVAADQQILGA